MDIFGSAAKARVKALEEALKFEQARSAELTRQIIALSDSKAYRILNPKEVTKSLVTDPPGVMRKPTDGADFAPFIERAREAARAKRAVQ